MGQYTAEMKKYFDSLISGSKSVDMFLFSKSIDESTFTNLYHSFEKGSKGKYQGLVDDLVSQGAALLRDITEAVTQSANDNDDAGVLENIHDLSKEAIEHIASNCDVNVAKLITDLVSAQEQANG
jgi:hypothetical protein